MKDTGTRGTCSPIAARPAGPPVSHPHLFRMLSTGSAGDGSMAWQHRAAPSCSRHFQRDVLHSHFPPTDFIISHETPTHFCLHFEFTLFLIWRMMLYPVQQPLISTHTSTHAHTTLPDSITHVCSRPFVNLWIQTNFSFLT